MKNLDLRDLIAGVVLAGLGSFVALYGSAHYEVGTVVRMGPGFFPVTLGWILTGLGIVIALLSFRRSIQLIEAPPLALRALLTVPTAVLVFSLLVDRVGLVLATMALTLIAVAAERPFNIRRALVLGAGLALIAWLIFTVALNMNLPAFRIGD